MKRWAWFLTAVYALAVLTALAGGSAAWTGRLIWLSLPFGAGASVLFALAGRRAGQQE